MRVGFLALVVLWACKRAPEKPSEPRYCDQDLSGVWLNSSDSSFAYRLTDHGDTVRGKFFRRGADGGEATPPPGDDPLLIELHRTASALAGTMKTMGESESGRRCPIEFGLQVSSCQPGVLQVIAETSMAVREDCSRQKTGDGGELPPQLAEYRWERLPSGDGGSAR